MVAKAGGWDWEKRGLEAAYLSGHCTMSEGGELQRVVRELIASHGHGAYHWLTDHEEQGQGDHHRW